MSEQKNNIVNLLDYAEKVKNKKQNKNPVSSSDYEKIAKQFLLAIHEMTDPEFATMYAFHVGPDLRVDFIAHVTTSKDIYQMILTQDAQDAALNFDYIALLTYGWSAPIRVEADIEDEILPPSEHPERRRVKMVIFSDKFGQQMSAISFRSEDDEYVLEDYLFDDSGTGSLSNAIKALYI